MNDDTTAKKRRKPRELYDKESKRDTVGRPPLEESELTPEQKNFAMYWAACGDPIEAGKIIEMSDYKIKEYQTLKNVQEEMQRIADSLIGNDEDEIMLSLIKEIRKESAMMLIRKIRCGEISEKFLEKMFQWNLVQYSNLPQESMTNKTINKRKSKQISYFEDE